MAVCVAVIAKENHPLFLRTMSPEEELKFHYTVHTSLDVVEEKEFHRHGLFRCQSWYLQTGSDIAIGRALGKKVFCTIIMVLSQNRYIVLFLKAHIYSNVTSVSSLTKSSNDPRELYLGLLYPTEDYKVYGYVTNTKIKFVVVVESANNYLRDNEIRMMFQRLHVAYTDMFCNPFYNPGENITSRRFEKVVENMMKQD